MKHGIVNYELLTMVKFLPKPRHGLYATTQAAEQEERHAPQMPATALLTKTVTILNITNMVEKQQHISRPVRIKFKNNTETVEGNMVFNASLDDGEPLANHLTLFLFRANDAQKTERVFSLFEVDSIDYL